MAAVLLLVLLLSSSLLYAQAMERRGAAPWPTRNHYRLRHTTDAPPGRPILFETTIDAALNPDSVRIIADGAGSVIPSKTEWRPTKLSVSWVATGAAAYHVYFDEGESGETERQVEPAMVGAGDRITYGKSGVRGRLSVGLWAHPAPLDFDGDGDIDLIVGCPDRPYNGTYLFRNIGTRDAPLYDRAEWLGPGHKDLVAADINGDGAVDLITSGGYFSDVRKHRLARWTLLRVRRSYHVGRDDLWHPVDWDADGKIDLLIGVSDWREYGWDDAYNARGEWQRGPLHGYVYFHRNVGSNENPEYAEPERLPLDLYGSPAPNPVDWFGRGVFDLIGGSFLDTVTLFRNSGSRSKPVLDSGHLIDAGGKTLRMDLCMIQPRVAVWHADGRPSLLIGEEDGTVSLAENLSPRGSAPALAPPRYLMQVDPFVKSGALSRPAPVDWNGDGKLDLVAGNSAGYIQWFENTGTKEAPVFVDRGNLSADGKVIRRMAGPNGSIQGPAEAKWGYSNPVVADWDLDGKPDVVVNDIWGSVVWYRNTGTRTMPALAAARNIDVEWEGAPPKPDWLWWELAGKQLVTQWRTTPRVVDWDGDGLPDLVMLNHQGYLTLFRRARVAGALKLLPPEKIFVEANGRFLNLAAGRAGRSGRRKIDVADWDSDGDLDVIVDSDTGAAWYENTGTQARPTLQSRGNLVQRKLPGHSPTPAVVDWNGDGRLDLIVGAEDGFFYYFERSFVDGR